MSTTRISPEQNKALVLSAFDALFNKGDYQAGGSKPIFAERSIRGMSAYE
jgi:hypothetical protein